MKLPELQRNVRAQHALNATVRPSEPPQLTEFRALLDQRDRERQMAAQRTSQQARQAPPQSRRQEDIPVGECVDLPERDDEDVEGG
jgi:PAB1-binding protein PBP1